MSKPKSFNALGGADKQNTFSVLKSNDDKRLVFGWSSVAFRADGETVVDWQDDIIDIDALESAVYEYVINFGTAGEMHERGGVGVLVESVVFTKEKMDAMGIPAGIVPGAWWTGFKITDDSVWEKIKSGEYSMFSIEGTAQKVEA